MTRVLTISLMLGTLSVGCMSISERSDQRFTKEPPPVYPGVSFDLSTIGCSFSSDPTTAGFCQLALIPCILDLPFSLILDTLLFPFDLYKRTSFSVVETPPNQEDTNNNER